MTLDLEPWTLEFGLWIYLCVILLWLGCYFFPLSGQFGAILVSSWKKFGCLEGNLVCLGAILCHPGAILGLAWVKLGFTLVLLGSKVTLLKWKKTLPTGPCVLKSRALGHTIPTTTAYCMANVDFTQVLYAFLLCRWWSCPKKIPTITPCACAFGARISTVLKLLWVLKRVFSIYIFAQIYQKLSVFIVSNTLLGICFLESFFRWFQWQLKIACSMRTQNNEKTLKTKPVDTLFFLNRKLQFYLHGSSILVEKWAPMQVKRRSWKPKKLYFCEKVSFTCMGALFCPSRITPARQRDDRDAKKLQKETQRPPKRYQK